MLSKSPSTVGLVVGLLFAFIFVIGAIYFCINKKIMDEDQDQYYMEGGRKTSDDFYEKILWINAHHFRILRYLIFW